MAMFYKNNANECLNINENITNVNNYLDKKSLIQNKNLTDQKDLNVKLLNFNTRKFLEDLLANAYKKQISISHY